jgi:hypothetical protein
MRLSWRHKTCDLTKLIEYNNNKQGSIIMKKTIFIIIILCFSLNSNLQAINLNYSDQGEQIIITENELKINRLADYDFVKTVERYDIIQASENNLLYITFNYNGKFLYNVPHGRIKLLVLYTSLSAAQRLQSGTEMLLEMYDGNNKLVYLIFSGRYTIYVGGGYDNITATSELREGNTVYGAKNLKEDTLLPWVEGSKGSGIGEKIKVEYDTPRFFGIIISNGFVDYNRPHLFLANNRVKKIRVWFGDTELFEEFELSDTPNYQTIEFQGGQAKHITIEILDVYRGTRYDDTCINKILVLAL